jgi:hypothetical protein
VPDTLDRIRYPAASFSAHEPVLTVTVFTVPVASDDPPVTVAPTVNAVVPASKFNRWSIAKR